MEQGKNYYENAPLPVVPAEIDAVLVTHAHIDHTGLLPLLYREGFRGEIHATRATFNLCDIMLRDSAGIQEFEAEWQNRKNKRSGEAAYTPLYTTDDAAGVLKLFRPHGYDERFTLFDGIAARFVDAGHLLGSSSIELWISEEGETRKLVFSGDLGNVDQPLLRDATLIDEADYVVMESTYGDRVHKRPPDYAAALAEVLQRTFDRGGNVIVPSFAVGRTQELLYFIRRIKAEGLVHGHANFPVFVDSPLANAATRIFIQNAEFCYDEEARAFVDAGINPLAFEGLVISETSQDSIAINGDKRVKVVISASGMCEAGRIRHHLKHNLWDARNTILFVGFQAPGTLGRSLVDGTAKVKLFGESIRVNAEVTQLPGVSGHGDADFLIRWATHYAPKPRKLFVNHGESAVCDLFAKRLADEFGIDAVSPYSGSTFDLARDEFLSQAQPVPAAGKKTAPKAEAEADSPYQTLLAALERLSELLKSGAGRSNGELRSVTNRLNDISDAWERE